MSRLRGVTSARRRTADIAGTVTGITAAASAATLPPVVTSEFPAAVGAVAATALAAAAIPVVSSQRLNAVTAVTATATVAARVPGVVGNDSGTVATVLAFPSAEGFGAQSVGGRGSGVNDANRMTIYKVTTLNDPATRTATFDGSLRWAVEATGPRTIVFGVAGYITVEKSLSINNPFCTINAHIAPGDGVCLKSAQKSGMGVPFLINASHTTVRHLRSRMFIDPGLGAPGASHASIGLFNTAGKVVNDVIIDHCSGTWGHDVNVQLLSAKYSNVTIQWCIAAEGYGSGHQRMLSTYVGAAGDEDDMGPVTFHHNLVARGDYRDPQLTLIWGRAEVINQVGYYITSFAANHNVGAHGAIFPSGKTRFIGNIWTKANNASATDQNTGTSGPNNSISGFQDAGHNEEYKVYALNNIGPGRVLDADPNINSLATPQRHHYSSDPLVAGAVTTGFPTGRFEPADVPVVPTSPWQAWHDVLEATTAASKSFTNGASVVTVPAGAPRAGIIGAGACVPVRDACDQRIINYCKNDTLGATVTAQALLTNGLTAPNGASPATFPTLATTPALPADGGAQAWAPTGDAIPSTWKTANIPGGKFPYSTAPNGYTYAENYYNQVAGDTVP